MIEVYKIGLEWYDGTEDKNGGLFEYRIIDRKSVGRERVC